MARLAPKRVPRRQTPASEQTRGAAVPDPTSPAPQPHRARVIDLPPQARACSTLVRIDYANAILADIDAVDGAARSRTGEQWARAVLEDAPADTRSELTQGWSRLGIPLGPAGSDGHVLGWSVRRSTPDYALLAAGVSGGLRGELLVQCRQGRLLFASFIQHGSAEARALWAAVEHLHTPVMCRLVADAVTRATTSAEPPWWPVSASPGVAIPKPADEEER